MAESSEGGSEREWRPGKATEMDAALAQRRLTPEEIEEQSGKRLELRLRNDMPAVEVRETTPAREILEYLGREDVGGVALRDPDSGVKAVVVPVERYLELAGAELASNPFNKEGRLDGRIGLTKASLAASHVEEADPEAI